MIEIFNRFGVLFKNLSNVADPAIIGNRRGMPRPVKKSYFPVITPGPSLLSVGQFSSEAIRRRPLIALHTLRADTLRTDRQKRSDHSPKNQLFHRSLK